MLELLLVDPRSGARRRVPVAGPVATIGSDLGCDLVLAAPEVAKTHARIEATPFGWQVVRQGSKTPVQVNDAAVEKAPLQAGDVLRVGPFQLTVLSAAAPARTAPPPPPVPPDLEPEAPAVGRAPPRPLAATHGTGARPSAARVARVGAPRSAISPGLVWVGVGFLAVIAIVAFLLNSGSPPVDPELAKRVDDLIAEARVAAAECRFSDATETASSAERLATASMQPKLDRLRTDITAQRKRFETGRRACDELEKLVATDFTGRTLADVESFLSNYRDVEPLRVRAEKLRSDLVRRSSTVRPPAEVNGVSLPNDRTFQWCSDEAKKWLDQGEFAKARFVATSLQLKGADAEKQAELVKTIEAGARAKADEILAKVRDLCAQGRVLEALGEFGENDDRLAPLKTTEAWWDCVEEADRVEELVDQKIPMHARITQRRRHAPPRPKPTTPPAPAPAPASPPTVPPRDEGPFPRPDGAPKEGEKPKDGERPNDGGGAAQADGGSPAGVLRKQAEALLAQDDFAGAAQLFEQALAAAADENERARVALAQERAVRPLRLGARVAELLAQRPPSAPLAVTLRDGRVAKVKGSDGSRLLLAGDGAEESVAPNDLAARSLLELSGHLPLEPDFVLGRAFVALAASDEKAFLLCLDRVAADDSLRDARDRALALQRGLDAVPPRGFVRVGERWLTWAEKAEEDLKQEVRDAVAAFAASTATAAAPGAAAAGEKARARVTELAATSPALVLEELKARRAELSKEFFAAPEQEKLKKLRERLLELQTTRKEALTLIFDEAKYFYPHTPANETEYRAVQLEVDRRVAVVRANWGREEEEPPQPHVALPPSFAAVVRELRANRQMLHDVGADADAPEQALMIAWCLPSGAVVHVRNFALDYRERVRLDEDENVRAFNATIEIGDKGQGSGPTRDELALVAITNDYRAMLGRRALAYNEKLWRAARGHSDWMSRNGKLTHDEDDPKRADPYRRMSLEGYRGGAGENCSVGAGGSAGALHGWCQSSGHHRNLLYESHSEMGGAQVGPYWTENFGGAREYRGNLVH